MCVKGCNLAGGGSENYPRSFPIPGRQSAATRQPDSKQRCENNSIDQLVYNEPTHSKDNHNARKVLHPAHGQHRDNRVAVRNVPLVQERCVVGMQTSYCDLHRTTRTGLKARGIAECVAGWRTDNSADPAGSYSEEGTCCPDCQPAGEPGISGPGCTEPRGEHHEMKKGRDTLITTKSAGRPNTVSPKVKGGMSSARKKTAEDEMTEPMNAGSHEERPRGTDRKRSPAKVISETTVIIHEEEGRDSVPALDIYLKNRGIVHRAMELLEAWKYLPARISSARIPVDIIALRDDMDMIVQVISSKHPIPDANTLVRNYAEKIDALRLMGAARRYRKILMAYSMPCGWRHYDVLPGGLIPAWDLHKLPAA